MSKVINYCGPPCMRGHTEGRYSNHDCVVCNRERRRKRDNKAEALQKKKTWHPLNVLFERITIEEIKKFQKKHNDNASLASWIREAVEWRLEELGE